MATPTNLPASFSSGSTLSAATMNNLRGAFRVLQVVVGTTSTVATNTTTTFANTGLTATITPQATSSKILVIVNHNQCRKSPGNTQNAININLNRNGTGLVVIADALGYTNSALDLIFTMSATYLDSPNTTSATTYATVFRNFTPASNVEVQVQSVASTITLMEISA
jgi:hypothetical protein